VHDITSTPTSYTQNVAISVPDIVGKSYEEGSALLTDGKLVPSRIDESSSDFEAGVVIRTDPEAGVTVAPDQDITVYVSSGARAISVPAIVGTAEADAAAALVAAGLAVGSSTQDYSPTVAKGAVISADPAPGTELPEGTAVTLLISNGMVNVPDMTGKTIATATPILEALQLTVSYESDSGCGGNSISGQSAIGDVPQKSSITLRNCARP
jgi:serine/threonine-protein kinase